MQFGVVLVIRHWSYRALEVGEAAYDHGHIAQGYQLAMDRGVVLFLCRTVIGACLSRTAVTVLFNDDTISSMFWVSKPSVSAMSSSGRKLSQSI